MLRKLREKLTYANVVSTIAVLAALGGGSAYAASLITTSDIADNAVISRKIKNHTVKPADLAAARSFDASGRQGTPPSETAATAAVSGRTLRPPA
jgi:hypothetical protein